MRIEGFLALVLAGLLPVAAPAADEHWSYESETGPGRWADLDPAWALCDEGRAQSPIDIGRAKAQAAGPGHQSALLEVADKKHSIDVIDNGHTIQVTYDSGNALRDRGQLYELQQHHFHAPSEHTLDGREFPMEMHLVHRSPEGALAVLGVFIEEGTHNAAFEPVWRDLPDEPGERRHVEGVEVDIDDLLPPLAPRYRYSGSLTTPPCSEGVEWFLFANPVQLSAKQIRAFTEIFSHNRRPTRPLNDRPILFIGPTSRDGAAQRH
jgi:carbonic anhydrase